MRRPPQRVGSRLWAVPTLLAAVYLVALIVNFDSVTASVNSYGDAVIAPVLAKLAGQAPAGSQILLGHHAFYEEWLFLRATAGLSFYRQLWEIAPLVWTLAGIGLLGWTAARVFDRTAAVLAVVALICLSDVGRFSFLALDWHGLSVVHTILVAAGLSWLVPRAASIGTAKLAAVTLAVGLLSAPPTASDPLFPIWALGPLCLASGLVALRSSGRARWTVLVFALGTTLLAVLAGTAIAHVMSHDGVRASHFTYALLASLPRIGSNFGVLFRGFLALTGGYFLGMSPNVLGFMRLASGVLALSAVALVVLAGAATVLRRSAPERVRQPGAATAYVAFWLSSLILQLVAFVATGAAQQSLSSSRYFLAGYVAIIALLPLLARRGPRWRVAVSAGVCIFALSAIFQLIRQPFREYGPYPTAPVAARLLAFSRAYHVDYGYAGYWDAPDLTWLTRFRLDIYPVKRGCGPRGLCPWEIARIDSWYRPRRGTRSLLIADRAQPQLPRLDRRLGKPLAVRRIGQLDVAVYSYDIASAMLRTA